MRGGEGLSYLGLLGLRALLELKAVYGVWLGFGISQKGLGSLRKVVLFAIFFHGHRIEELPALDFGDVGYGVLSWDVQAAVLLGFDDELGSGDFGFNLGRPSLVEKTVSLKILVVGFRHLVGWGAFFRPFQSYSQPCRLAASVGSQILLARFRPLVIIFVERQHLLVTFLIDYHPVFVLLERYKPVDSFYLLSVSRLVLGRQIRATLCAFVVRLVLIRRGIFLNRRGLFLVGGRALVEDYCVLKIFLKRKIKLNFTFLAKFVEKRIEKKRFFLLRI